MTMNVCVCVCVCVEGYCLMFSVKFSKQKVQFAANMQWKNINQECGSNKSKKQNKMTILAALESHHPQQNFTVKTSALRGF